MKNDILDDDYRSDPDSWDSKTRISASDAIIEVNDNATKLTRFRWGILLFVFLGLLGPVISLFSEFNTSDGEFDFVLGIITLLLALPYLLTVVFFNRNPKLWLIICLVTYLLTFVLISVLSGEGANGIIWKIGIIIALSYAVFSASEWEKNLRKLRDIGYPIRQLQKAKRKLTPLPRLKRKPR